MTKLNFTSLLLIALIIFWSCNRGGGERKTERGSENLKVVSTTTMITDLLKQLAGDKIELHGLMGPGVDPHLYKASEGDVAKLFNADIILYNGLHLEGKMVDLFEKMQKQGKDTYPIANAIPESDLISIEGSDVHHDPHIWFSVSNWKLVAKYVADLLERHDKKNAVHYAANLKKYLGELENLSEFNVEKIARVPKTQRVLITAHDAFEYFGREYGFEVKGLQGISTVSEAGAADVKNLANFIAERKIPALFIESSVPHRNIEALQAAVESRGFDVKIGGELFSDALGSAGTQEGTYIGMYRHNITKITDALK
jgi:manganese/zinc/iron transport system substrate-binding protein